MRTHPLKFVLLVVLCAVSAPAEEKDDSVAPLLKTLSGIGDTYDIFFSVEEIWIVGKAQNPILTRRVKLGEHTTADTAIEALKTAMSDVSVRRSTTSPNIVHIIDTQLLKRDDYVLNKTLAKLEFKGSPTPLIGRIANEVEGIPEMMSVPLGDGMVHVDYTTPLEINAKNASVRQILSDYIPLHDYSRVIWRAMTTIDKKSETDISYSGRRRKGSQLKDGETLEGKNESGIIAKPVREMTEQEKPK